MDGRDSKLRRIKIPKNFQTTGDASVESDGLTTQFGVPVDIHGDFRGLKNTPGAREGLSF